MQLTYRELKKEFVGAISTRYDARESEQIFFLALEDIWGISRSQYFLKSEQLIDLGFHEAVISLTERLKAGEPIQYIIGRTHFDDLFFKVDSRVLIPRPETEELVRWIAEDNANAENVLDLGTGSGCILISLLNRYVNLNGVGVDESADALDLASENASILDVDSRASWLNADMTKETGWQTILGTGKYDVVVSNPPYIAPDEMGEMRDHVLDFEPHLALFSEDPLFFYRTILEHSLKLLKPGGDLYFEIHESHYQEVEELAEKFNYTETEVRKDLQGKPRMFRARRI